MTDYWNFCGQKGLRPDSREIQQQHQQALARLATQLESAMEALYLAAANSEFQAQTRLTTFRLVVTQAEAEDAIETARYPTCRY